MSPNPTPATSLSEQTGTVINLPVADPANTVVYGVLYDPPMASMSRVPIHPEVLYLRVPRTFKVTYGPLVPGSRNSSSSHGQLTFRVYDGPKCRFLLANVLAFWTDQVEAFSATGEDINLADLYTRLHE